MTATTWLDFQAIVHSTFDDGRDLIRSLRIGNCRWGDRDSKVVRLDMRELEEWFILESHKVLIASKRALYALLRRRT